MSSWSLLLLLECLAFHESASSNNVSGTNQSYNRITTAVVKWTLPPTSTALISLNSRKWRRTHCNIPENSHLVASSYMCEWECEPGFKESMGLCKPCTLCPAGKYGACGENDAWLWAPVNSAWYNCSSGCKSRANLSMGVCL